jgi:hypothetical protein
MNEQVSSEEKAISQSTCFMNPHGKIHCMHNYTWATTAGIQTADKCCWCGALENRRVALAPEHGIHV